MIKQYDAVGHIFLKAVTGQRAFAAFTGYDSCNPAVLEPSEQPAQFRTQDPVIRQAGEQSLERIQNDSFCANGVDGVTQADKEPFEIVCAGLLDLAPLDMDVINAEFFLLDEFIEIKAQ
jgi:hypothetical protein